MGELIVQGIKYALFISIAIAFAGAILTLLNLIVSVVMGSIIGEALGLVSMFLPFDAYAVFSAIATILDAILAFYVARACYALVANRIGL